MSVKASADAKQNAMDTIPKQIAEVIEELGNIAPIYNEALELRLKAHIANATNAQLTETLQLVNCKNGFHKYYLHKLKTKLTPIPVTAIDKLQVTKLTKPSLQPKKNKLKPRKLPKAKTRKQSELDRMLQYAKTQKMAKVYGTGASGTSWPKNFPEGLIRIEQGGKIESNRRKF